MYLCTVKILIIRFSSIGDIVMMTPAMRCLALQSDYQVHFLTKKVFGSLAEHNPYLSKIYFLEDEDLIDSLKSENYTHCIDLHNNIRSHKLTKQLKLKTKRINKLTWPKLLKIHTPIDRLPRKLHVAHRALHTIEFLGVQDDDEGMEVFFPDNYSFKEPVNGAFITLALGTAKVTKNILVDQLRFIIEKCPIPVILLGGNNEKDLGEKLANDFEHVYNLAGHCSLLDSMFLVKKCRFFIGGDTGLLHIACALKVPTISIWGATIPEFGVFPYYGKYDVPHYIHEVQGLNCRPCSKHGTQKCPKGHYSCMKDQSLSSIERSIQQLSSENQKVFLD